MRPPADRGRLGWATAKPLPRREANIVREFSVPASFTVGEHDTIVSSVFAHERDDPDHVIFQRLVDGAWTDVTCAQAAEQIRSAALGLIAEGVQPGDRVAIFSATRYEWPILDFAILSVGAVTVPIYETSSAEQVRFVLQRLRRRAGLRRDRRARRQDRTARPTSCPSCARCCASTAPGPRRWTSWPRRASPSTPSELDDRLAGDQVRRSGHARSTPRAPPAGPRAAS